MGLLQMCLPHLMRHDTHPNGESLLVRPGTDPFERNGIAVLPLAHALIARVQRLGHLAEGLTSLTAGFAKDIIRSHRFFFLQDAIYICDAICIHV